MNGVHDVGGMHGFGPVAREVDEPAFHAAWEGRMFGISRACVITKVFNQDEARHGIERMPPAEYLRASYYERFLSRTLRLLAEKRLVSREEVDIRVAELAERPDTPLARCENPDLVARVERALRVRPDYRRPAPPPRFAEGDRVLARSLHPAGHTRLPRYARGKVGLVHHVHGGFIFPDTNAHGGGEQANTLYSVRFDAAELWGPSAEPRAPVYLDLWERYLEPAPSDAAAERGRR
jgi:nitrile hydratase subunit beta